VKQLLICGHDLDADLVVISADAPHVMFHPRAPHHRQVVAE